jgi:membrane protein insertase Oxa1/YidC/SpoIIIJ
MQYTSPKFITLPDSIREIIETRIVVWQTGDKYFKLADEHYGNPNLWWIIASYNMAPTEAHLDIGDIVYVPINWDVIYDTVRG